MASPRSSPTAPAITGDLLVGADGCARPCASSSARAAAQLRRLVAWRAMLDERDVPPGIQAEMFERYAFCLPEGEHVPRLSGARPQRRDAARPPRLQHRLVPADRPGHDADRSLHRCDRPVPRHSIPPPLIRPEVTAAIKATARALVAPQIAEIFARTRPFFQPIYDLESPQMAFGRVALLGDAAFVARPHVGAGVTKAALDAAASPTRSRRRPRCRTRALSSASSAVRQRHGRARAAGRRLSQRPAQAARASAAQRSSSATSTTCSAPTTRAARACARRCSKQFSSCWPTEAGRDSVFALLRRAPPAQRLIAAAI